MKIGGVVASAFGFALLAASACGSSSDRGSTAMSDGGALDGGGSSSGTTSSSSGASSGGLVGPCQAYARGLCAWLFRCIPNEVRAVFAEVDTCMTRVNADCERTNTARGASALTNACGDELETYTCAAPIEFKVPPVLRTPGCDVRGTLGDSRCERDRQCQSGACTGGFVDSAGQVACGRCRAFVAEDGSCTSDAPCAIGLQCMGGLCKKPPVKDEACSSRQCERPLRCIGAKCVDALPPGAPCNVPVATEDPCDATKGLTCTNGTCQPASIQTLATKADGDTCTQTLDCLWPSACVQGICKIPELDCP